MMNPLRYWRTGAIAVVMAALGQASGAAGRGAADERLLVRRQSPYGVTDTVLRIEGSARQHGMAVFARFEQRAHPIATARGGAGAHVIVLESSQGGTPVLMGATWEQIELPLSLIVRLADDGRAEVLVGGGSNWVAMPQALAHDLAQLTAVLSEALQAEAPPPGAG